MEDKMFQTTNQKMESTFRTTIHHLPEETTHRDATARAPQRLTQRWTRLLGAQTSDLILSHRLGFVG